MKLFKLSDAAGLLVQRGSGNGNPVEIDDVALKAEPF